MKKIFILALLTQLTACNFDSDNQNHSAGCYAPNKDGAFIRLVASDYSASDLAFLCQDNTLQSNLAPSAYSDITYQLGAERLYQIGRYELDYIASINYQNLNVDYQYSVNDAAQSGANPYRVIEVSTSKAYVIRYGANDIWQINPSATLETNFKEDSIDLSSFSEKENGKPEMADAVLMDDILYVILQRLDGYDAINKGLLVAIDTNDNSLIDLDAEQEGVNGLELLVTNPSHIQLQNGSLIIDGIGRYAAWDGSRDAEYTGGVEQINLQTFEQTMLYYNDASTGQTQDVALSAEFTVLNQYHGYQSNKVLILKDGETTELDPEKLNGDITFISISPENEIWVGFNDNIDPKIFVYQQTEQGWNIKSSTSTVLVPKDVLFVRQ